MDNKTSQNQVNGNSFSQNQNISDKHIDFVNHDIRSNQPLPQSSQQQAQRLITPDNLEQVLGKENVIRPDEHAVQPIQNIDHLKSAIVENTQQQPPQISPVELGYSHLTPKSEPHERNEILKMIMYIVPVLAIFFLFFKPITDSQFMRHVRQSLVAQGLWLSILFILRFLSLPLIDPYGIGLWNIICMFLLLVAGVKAYNHEFFEIPVAYDLGKNFIEEK